MARRSGFGEVSKNAKIGIAIIFIIVAMGLYYLMNKKDAPLVSSSMPQAITSSIPQDAVPQMPQDAVPQMPQDVMPQMPQVEAPPIPQVSTTSLGSSPIQPVQPSPMQQAPPYTLVGQGVSSADNIRYMSGAWELLKPGEPQSTVDNFTNDVYLEWVRRTFEIIQAKYPDATSFTVWRDGGYRVYSGARQTSSSLYPDGMTQTYSIP